MYLSYLEYQLSGASGLEFSLFLHKELISNLSSQDPALGTRNVCSGILIVMYGHQLGGSTGTHASNLTLPATDKESLGIQNPRQHQETRLAKTVQKTSKARAEIMAQWVKCLSQKHENWSSDTQKPYTLRHNNMCIPCWH